MIIRHGGGIERFQAVQQAARLFRGLAQQACDIFPLILEIGQTAD